MSIIVQFNCSSHNETARKAMESYVGILQKAFEHYQNLWEDYIKLQEKYGQCNGHSSPQVTIDTEITEREVTSQQLNNTNVRESSTVPLLELDTALNICSINSDTGTSQSDASESLHRDADENNMPASPVFSKTFPRTGDNPAKKFVRSPKAMYNDSISDTKIHHSTERISSRYNNKLDISTTHHVETTFLPNGKRLKQSRLVFYPLESNEKMLSSSVDKHKSVSILHDVEPNFIEEISVVNTVANVTVAEKGATNTNEIFEDVIEISPTQRNITSKVKRCLKLKRKNPAKHVIKISPNKNKYPGHRPDPNVKKKIEFGLCPSPKRVQKEDDKSLIATAVNTSKDKVDINYLSPIKIHKANVQTERSIKVQKGDQLSINKVQNLNNTNNFACEDETFYLSGVASKNDMDNLNLDNTENKPPEKKRLSDKFNILSKRKVDVSKQLNIRCKADRAKLNGLDCWECKQYYKNLSLSEEELQKRMNQCSRHRHKYERPNTPEGFWDPEFPETLSSTYR